VVGAGHALGGQGRRDGVPTRSTLAACAISLAAIASAITFGASVRSLLDTPTGFGWSADLAVNSGGGYDFLDPEGGEQAAATKGIDGLTVAGFASLSVGGREVNAIGMQAVEGEPVVTLVRGHLPVADDEVALGASTARDLSVGPGDRVETEAGRLDVVGIVALPPIGPVASAHPSLGQGALLTLEGLMAADDNAYPSLALIRVAPGVDVAREAPRLTRAVAQAMSESPPDFAASYRHLRPSEVIGLQPASRTAYLLAGVLGVASVLALSLTLSASVRRRRTSYAVLSALGFDRRGLRRTVRWQLNLVTALSLVVVLPIGIVVGRVAWRAFADQLGAASDPRVPVALLAAVAVGLVVLANLMGEWPARLAGRHQGTLSRRG
jgi:putative ABC transport system permease protein